MIKRAQVLLHRKHIPHTDPKFLDLSFNKVDMLQNVNEQYCSLNFNNKGQLLSMN